MCRALLYLGEPVVLDSFLYQPDSALVRQSYMPKMLHMLNLAGFGMRAWDRRSREPAKPWAYGSTGLPVFDRNLKSLAEKVEAGAVLAHVRGVAYSTAVDISLANVHPFQFPGCPVVMAHNGDLARFADLRPALAAHVPASLARHVRGTTDSEWIYALILSGLRDPFAVPSGGELVEAVARALAIIRRERAGLGIDISSAANLFVTDGTQIVATRYCFDFGRYATDDPAKLHEANLRFVSLWYTLGRDYGLHEGEWKMVGGAEAADSILVASEPLTRDVAAWVEVPEYAMLHACIRDGRPAVTLHYLD
ncbi:MAG: class II glutamine amidotransferase [Betaproteobacteria bacterium]|jgi:predicted glutamine amidotransferase|nr:class II glutamine amidotransferase [Betaproteobacteria bacterium]